MFIGKVAEKTGASPKAIRHYESIGLIETPQRQGSYRVYSEHDVLVIGMIRTAQNLGFSLSELKEVVTQKAINKQLPFDLINTLIDEKKSALMQKTQQLLEQVDNLEKFKAQLLTSFS